MIHSNLSAIGRPLILAKRQVARSILASSYDRRGGNHDWSNYVRVEGSQAVMMEAEGPGVVTRIWTADPQKGIIRIFLDGEFAVERPFAKLFEKLPLSFGMGGESADHYVRSKAERIPMGFTSYCPIPFQRRCKITIEPEDDYLYYHVNAHLLPPGETPDRFDPGSEPILKAHKALAEWESGKPLVDMSRAASYELPLRSGESGVIGGFEGAGVIRGLRLSLPSNLTPEQLEHVRENVWLVARFDDDEPRDPSIRAPIGPLFLDFGQIPTPRSLFCGSDEQGYYCFFAMPFRERADLRLINRSLLPVRVSGSLLQEPLAEFDPDLFRFRASWHVETPFGADHRDYEGLACRLLNLDGADNVELLQVQGAGHFVGCGFSIDLRDAPTDRAACEGDEMFFIDDDARLTHYGTGTEDYVNDAWGVTGYAGPWSGDAVVDNAQLYGYRLHVPDPIAFRRCGRFTLEHGTGNNCSGLYRSIAYWYMDPAMCRTRVEERRWEEIRTGKRRPNEPMSP